MQERVEEVVPQKPSHHVHGAEPAVGSIYCAVFTKTFIFSHHPRPFLKRRAARRFPASPFSFLFYALWRRPVSVEPDPDAGQRIVSGLSSSADQSPQSSFVHDIPETSNKTTDEDFPRRLCCFWRVQALEFYFIHSCCFYSFSGGVCFLRQMPSFSSVFSHSSVF